MRALRLRFLLVAVAVLVPVGLLVWRAMASVEVEEQRRHEVIADRLFDEMERTLSDVLRDVEAPNADTPAKPWIIGRFDVAPDGRITASPSIAATPELMGTLAGGSYRERADVQQRAGSTVSLDEDAKKEKNAPAYDALSSLNKGAEQRMQRQKTLADAYASGERTGRDDYLRRRR